MYKFALLFLLLSQISFAQKNAVSDIINKIEFQEDTIKSVYDWITDNIKYDVGKLEDISGRGRSDKNPEFQTEEEYKAYLLENVIKKKKGVCEDYSLLFDEIVKTLGYESYVINGYTKNDKGRVNKSIGHTWNAVKVNGKWKMYDSTWGAGYIEDDKKFVKNYYPEWCDVKPDILIKTHMPYDPIWQLSDSPIMYTNFENNSPGGKSEPIYDYQTLITEFVKKGKKEQMQDQVNRSLSLGDGVRLIEKWRKELNNNIEMYEAINNQDVLKKAFEDNNNAVAFFNKYIDAKNHQFKGKKWQIDVAKQNLFNASSLVESALDVYSKIKLDDTRGRNTLKNNQKNAMKLHNAINVEKSYIEQFN